MKLCLGTVQLGMQYGVCNNKKPDYHESIQILKTAYENGIEYFDTASAYGKSEEIIGQFIELYNLRDRIKVISKIQDVNPNLIHDELCISLDKLKMNYIDGYLMHDPGKMYDTTFLKKMEECKKIGLVKNIGVSIYDPKDAIYASQLDCIDYIQVPYNMFDQRLETVGFFEKAKENSKTVFARSTLLQGLLSMNPEEIPEDMLFAKKDIIKFNELLTKHKESSKVKTAIQYTKQNQYIHFIVFGVDSQIQLIQFINNFNSEDVKEELFVDIKNTFTNVDERVISPNLWRIR